MLRPLLFSITLFILHAQASPAITYHGRLLKSDSTAVTGSVQFKIQIRSPGSEDCLMFEETQTKVLADGVFSLSINDGSVTRSDTTGLDFEKIFSNHDKFTLTGHCAIGNTFPMSGTLSPSTVRNLVISFNDGTAAGWQSLTPMAINFVPSAVEAIQVSGFKADNLLRVMDASNVPQSAPALTPGNATELMAILAGTTSMYVKNNGTNWSPTGAVNMNSQVINNVAAPSAATDAVNKNYADTRIGGSTTNLSGVGSGLGNGKTLIWNASTSTWETGTPSATDATKLPLAGGTMTGPLVMNGTYIHMGNYTDSQESTLVGGLTTSHKGVVWYNTTSNAVKVWNGTSASALGSGAGSVTGVTATAPIISSGGTAPDISISFGNGLQNTAGVLVAKAGTGIVVNASGINVDIGTAANQFQVNSSIPNCLSSEKLQMSAGPTYSWSCVTDQTGGGGGSPTGSAGGSLSGTYPNPTIASGAVGSTEIADGSIVAADIGIGAVTSSGILDGTIASADLASSIASGLWTSSGSDIYRSSGKVGIGTTNPTSILSIEVPTTESVLRLSRADSAQTWDFNLAGNDFNIRDLTGSIIPITILNGSGNVGIGIGSPTDKLEVNGKIRATHICAADGTNCKDTTTSWSGGGSVTGVTATAPLVSSGGTAPDISITADSIAAGQLAANSVAASELADNAVDTNAIVNSNVTYAKIQNVSATDKLLGRATAGAGVMEELALGTGLSFTGTTLNVTGAAPTGTAGGSLSGSYPNPTIAAGVISTTELAANAVTSAKILDGTIASADITDGTVATADILDGTILGADINTSAVITMAQSLIAPVSNNRQSNVGAWSDISGSGNGTAVFGSNVYLGNADNAMRYSNTHASIGAAGMAINWPAWGDVSFFSQLNATTAGSSFSPSSKMTINASGVSFSGVLTGNGSGLSNVAASSIADNSITSAKIVDGAVGNVDLANNSVTSAKINDGSVTNDDIADGNVLSAEIGDGTIVGADISSSAALSVASVSTSGSVSASGSLVGGNGYLYLNGKETIRGSDSWLRLNQNGDYTSGIHTPSFLNASAVTVGALYTSPGAGNLTVSGNVTGGAFYYSSDRRLKTNVQPIDHALDIVRRLNGVRFDWKQSHQPDIGFIAQEVEAIEPSLVQTSIGELHGVVNPKSVKYGNVVAIAVEAIKEVDLQCKATAQEMQALKDHMQSIDRRVASLEAENAELRKQNESLEARLSRLESKVEAKEKRSKKSSKSN